MTGADTPHVDRVARLGHSIRIPGFRNLFSSSMISVFGGSVSAVAVNWIVYTYTHSAIAISYVGLTGVIPGIVLGLFAGVVADRYNRRSLMVLADVSRMVIMAILSVTLFLVGFSLVLILAAMILVNSFTEIFAPASQAILPRLVPKGSLEDANGLLRGTAGAVSSIGSAGGGIVVVLAGAVWGLGINAMTYALSAAFILQISGELGRVRQSGGSNPRSFRKDFVEGTQYMRAHIPILEITIGFLPVNFLSALVGPFFVVYATAQFHGNAAVYGYIVAIYAAGIAVGALLAAPIRARRFAGLVMGLCILVDGGATVLMAYSHDLGPALSGVLGVGLAIGLINTVYYATMQAVVPGELLARVLSIDSVGSFASIPAGLAVGGILAVRYGIDFAFFVAGAGLLASGIVALILPGFRKVRYDV